MDKKGPWKNGGPEKDPPADLSVLSGGEQESIDILSKGQVLDNKAIVDLHLTSKPSLRLRATESALLTILHRLLFLYHLEAIDWLQKNGYLPTQTRY